MLEINFQRNRSISILDLSGNIDIDASNFIEKVGWCLENAYTDILCNFENVNLVDYAGLSVLAIACKNVDNHKGRIKFVNVPAHIKKVFSLTGVDKIFQMYENDVLALNSFKEDKVIAEIQKKSLRRRFKRLPLDITVEFRAKSREEKWTKGKVLNLSAVGMLVFANKIYPLGELLDVRLLLLPKPGVLEIDAKVVWQVAKEREPHIYPGMGLEFHKLESAVQKKLVEFVERNLPLGCN